MPQGDKDKYTDKQKRMADHIEKSYEDRGVSEKEAEARAWATVNKIDHGGKMPGGSGRRESKREDRRHDGSTQSTASRSSAAKLGWETRRANEKKRAA